MEECKPLSEGSFTTGDLIPMLPGRRLHSSTFQLDLSRFVTDRLTLLSVSHKKSAYVGAENVDEC